jgi:16S rRNA (cytidine1402-2'-O)-methyltransferase
MPSTSPRLLVVATPLGNPGDASPRAREAIAAADLVLAEDTRRAGLLFQRLGVKAERLRSFHDHNEDARLDEVLEALQAGSTVVLVSDAGTPLVSDPGYRLVRACREAGFEVSPVPGPSAVLAALSASGLPPHPFAFLGFLPRKDSERLRLLESWRDQKATLVFFERKDRLRASLEAAFRALGPREFCVARELTKDHEEFILGRLDGHGQVPGDLLGEITVVVGPPGEVREPDQEHILALIREERGEGGRPRDVARRVAARAPGWSAKRVYELLASAGDRS